MSYQRFGDDSEVYVYLGNCPDSNREGYVCCACKLSPPCDCGCRDNQVFETPKEMIVHLIEHQKAGHLGTDYAIKYLKKDLHYMKYPVLAVLRGGE